MTTEFQTWYQELQVERTMKALRKNNFDAQFVAKATDASGAIFKMIPDGAIVGVGGSVTLSQIGFFEEAAKHAITLLNPSMQQLSMDEFLQKRREILHADIFLCSSNAVTEDGKLYNIDGTGNRVAGMTFGPKKVILVCGVNKIVRNIEEAQKKVQEWTAPMNAKRLALKTPCAETGVCSDCASPQRICNVYVVTAKKPSRTDVTVLIVGEPLGL
ncbi:MAG TPA: lactate utilization protein [Syntrophorhabdales bacterium]|nr:lactate utilization protein [Syntrophorhabdales bacterium]